MRFSESTKYPEVIICLFLLSTCNRNTCFQTININQYFVVSERKMKVVIEQTRFPSTVFSVFLRSEFKLGNIYSGVNFPGKMFAVIFICGNLFLRIAGKTAKIGTRKKFVPHGKGTRFIRRLQKSREVSVNSVE